MLITTLDSRAPARSPRPGEHRGCQRRSARRSARLRRSPARPPTAGRLSWRSRQEPKARSPTGRSSLPVVSTATLGRRPQRSEPKPSEAAAPICAAPTRMPDRAVPRCHGGRRAASPPDRVVAGGTGPRHPDRGIAVGAQSIRSARRHRHRRAAPPRWRSSPPAPARQLPAKGAPADSPITSKPSQERPGGAGRKPSIAELVNGGRSMVATTGSAR